MKISELKDKLEGIENSNGDIEIVAAEGRGKCFAINEIVIDHYRDDYTPYARLLITS